LHLRPNYKILPRLKEYSRRKDVRVIGFKLLLNEPLAHSVAAAREMLSSDVDAVVANEWSSVERDRARHPGAWVRAGHAEVPFGDLQQLNAILHDFLAKGVSHGSLS
jgi:phosphopantothenoylcysteine decarboxylase/phosphopantothenate--cysteine ligase